MAAVKVELHIERLVLEGVGPADRLAVGAALERELGRLISERGLPPRLAVTRELPAVDGGRLGSAPANAAGTGRAIARSVYRGMGSRGSEMKRTRTE